MVVGSVHLSESSKRLARSARSAIDVALVMALSTFLDSESLHRRAYIKREMLAREHRDAVINKTDTSKNTNLIFFILERDKKPAKNYTLVDPGGHLVEIG